MKHIDQLIVMVIVAVFGLSSCDQTAERAFYDESSLIGYSFYQKTVVTEFTLEDNGVYNVKVCRSNASQATSVTLKLTESTGNFTLESPTASFEAGKFETIVPVKYVLQNLDPSVIYRIALQLPSGQLSYGTDSILTIQGSMKMTWKKVGTGLFSSQFFDEDFNQDLYQCNEATTLYKLPNCYFRDYDLLFTLNVNNSITYATQPVGYNHPTYGMTSWMMPAATSATQPYKNGNVYYFVPRFTVSAGSFGQALETLTMP